MTCVFALDEGFYKLWDLTVSILNALSVIQVSRNIVKLMDGLIYLNMDLNTIQDSLNGEKDIRFNKFNIYFVIFIKTSWALISGGR